MQKEPGRGCTGFSWSQKDDWAPQTNQGKGKALLRKALKKRGKNHTRKQHNWAEFFSQEKMDLEGGKKKNEKGM